MNFMDMIRQGGALKQKMQEMQEKMASLEVEGVSGGGLVRVTMNGQGFLTKVSIDPSLLSADNAETVQDLLVAAANDAKQNADAMMEKETKSMIESMGLPAGLF